MIPFSFKKSLSAGGFFKVKHLKSVGSTNDVLKSLPPSSAREGFCLVADEQTKGRGRFDRKFFSEKGGLYFSFLLKPKSREVFDLLTVIAAISVCDAVREYDETASIKWVNDVLIDDKKCCGILAESTENLNGFAVVGIGVNILGEELDDSIKDLATCVRAEGKNARWELLLKILANFKAYYQDFDKAKIVNAYKKACSTLGKRVEVLSNDGTSYVATAEDLDEDCRLVVKRDDGEKKVLSSGEVKVILA